MIMKRKVIMRKKNKPPRRLFENLLKNTLMECKEMEVVEKEKKIREKK